MQKRIEDYFQYKWQNDQNLAIIEEDDIKLLGQLDNTSVQNRLFTDFLFKKFLKAFENDFKVPHYQDT